MLPESGRPPAPEARESREQRKDSGGFIRLGSKSYISGKPYKMRYPDGTTIEVEKFFRDRLKAGGY